MASTSESWYEAFYRLVWRNKRRYGGYVIHLGVVFMAIGIAGSSVFQQEAEATMSPGETFDIGGYTVQYSGLDSFQASGVDVVSASLVAFRNGEPRFRMLPQRHFHPPPNDENPTTEVAIWSSLQHDLYMVLAGWDGQNQTATFKAYLNPLVGWIWIGGWVLLFGTIICMIPDRRRSNIGIQNY